MQDIPVKGKRFVIEKKDNKYDITHKDGSQVDVLAKMMLMKEFSKKSEENEEEIVRMLFPATPVKPGDTWKVDMEALAKIMSKSGGMAFDTAKATGTGKLLKTYMKEGKQFGELTIELKLPVTEMEKQKLAKGEVLVQEIKFDGCIDGTSETGTMTKKGSFTGTGPAPKAPPGRPQLPPGTNMTLTVNSEGTETHTDVPKKK